MPRIFVLEDVGFDCSLMGFPSAEVPRRSRVAVSADPEATEYTNCYG